GMEMATQIVRSVKTAYETQGAAGLDVFAVAERELEQALTSERGSPLSSDGRGIKGEGQETLRKAANGPTVVSIVGVNGTGKTTTAAKLAHWVQSRGQKALLAACDTFRA